MNLRVWNRKAHRWGAVAVAAPFLLVLVSGLLLQLKKQLPWVQPPTARGQGKEPRVSFDAVLAAVREVPEAGVSGWADIDRMDVRPKDGVVKVQCRNRYEVQIDFQTGAVVRVAYRRSDLIESLHDGSWFGDAAKVYVFFPIAVVVLMLWATGVYLWLLPVLVRRRAARDRAAVADRPAGV